MNWKEKAALLVSFLIAFGFGAYKLTESPATWFDEGMIVQLAINLAEQGFMGLQTSPGNFASSAYISVGFPLIFPLAAVFKIAGVGLLQARIFMLFWILILVASGYWYILKTYGLRAAFFAGLLLATFAPLYGNGKNVLGEVPGLVFFILFLLLLQRIEKGGFLSKPHLFFVTGFALGLFVVTKPIFLLALGAFLIVIFWRSDLPILRNVWRSDPPKFQLRSLLIFGAGAALPLSVWFFTQFSFSDSFRDVLAFYRNPYALENIFSAMAENFARFFREPATLYTALLFGIWGASFALRFKRHEGVSVAEKTAFVFSFLVLFFYLRTPGWYRYFFPAQIISLIYFPSSFIYLLSNTFKAARYSRSLAAAIVILCLAAFQAYQVGFDSWVAGSYSSTRTKELNNYFKAWNPETSLFVYNSPEIVVFFPRNAVYSQFLEINKGVVIGQRELERLSRDKFADRVVLATDESGLDTVDLFPSYQIKDRVNRYLVLTLRNER